MNADRVERARTLLRLLFVAFYFAAGVLHLHAPEPFVAIVPDWVPYPHATVIFTGICELLGAAGLLIPAIRRLAGIMLALYAICVLPANIKHAIAHVPLNGYVLGWWYHAPRLALQPVLVWGALFCSAVIDWPFRPRS